MRLPVFRRNKSRCISLLFGKIKYVYFATFKKIKHVHFCYFGEKIKHVHFAVFGRMIESCVPCFF